MVSDKELQKVIGDFLEMGHVENIISMFRHEPDYLKWTGIILQDERINVRLGLSVLFEEFKQSTPDLLPSAISSLEEVLLSEEPLFRGEAISLLGIINTEESMRLVNLCVDDPSPQVREMAEIVLLENQS